MFRENNLLTNVKRYLRIGTKYFVEWGREWTSFLAEYRPKVYFLIRVISSGQRMEVTMDWPRAGSFISTINAFKKRRLKWEKGLLRFVC